MNAIRSIVLGGAVFLACATSSGASDPGAAAFWFRQFASQPLESRSQGAPPAAEGELPKFSAAAPHPGRHLVRASIPFAPGVLPKGKSLAASAPGNAAIPCDVRPLSNHPGSPRFVRRALVTFPFDFLTTARANFALELGDAPPLAPPESIEFGATPFEIEWNGRRIRMDPGGVSVGGGSAAELKLSLISPPLQDSPICRAEVIERGAHFLWLRLLAFDPALPRIIEARIDSDGTLALDAAIQRGEAGDSTAPDFGWLIQGREWCQAAPHRFREGAGVVWPSADASLHVSFPRAADELRSIVEVAADLEGKPLRYVRALAEEKVPFQSKSWRRAAVVIGAGMFAPRNALLEPELKISIDPKYFEAAYGLAPAPDLSATPELAALEEMNRSAILASQAAGDDFGNVTSYNAGQLRGGAFGMNRLNHSPSIFEDAWRKDDRRLRSVAALWCQNMRDLSIWWGNDEGAGGTRYNNAVAAGDKTHEGDANFMWRTNSASHFCTKGLDSFYLAYEETGDPAMLAALRAQLDYAKKNVRADKGEARNIGDVADYVRLYELTGREEFREEALRLFREIRSRLSPGDLFSQSGDPIVADLPFIENDATGYKHPFAKPYIIGYALAGLPELMSIAPDEPKLRDVVRAVADFLASTVDPAGGWRYPHPRSSSVIIGQGLEHAAQLCRAAEALEARREPIENLLDAIEIVLQARVLAFAKSGKILSGLGSWEAAAGMLGEGKPTLEEFYATPEARDRSRDYTEGAVGLGSAPPEGLVYLNEVLAFYLKRRSAERLFEASPELRAVLDRIPASPADPLL